MRMVWLDPTPNMAILEHGCPLCLPAHAMFWAFPQDDLFSTSGSCFSLVPPGPAGPWGAVRTHLGGLALGNQA
jgi:hypothetical protein